MDRVTMAAADELSVACVGGGSETAIEDLPADVLALVLRRLDGASLAAVGCACSSLHELAADPGTWRALCLAEWPSVRGVAGVCHRALFADAFPFPSWSPPPAAVEAADEASSLPARLVSAVDLRHGGELIMSRAVETDTSSAWFHGAPFRVDALAQEGLSAPSAITPTELTLSWVLIDPATGRAVNASSRRPVAVDRKWLTGETVTRFTVVLGGGVALDAAVTFDDRYGHVREVALCAEDGEGAGVRGRDGLAAVAVAMAGPRQGHGGAAAAEENSTRLRYEEFVKGRRARKERAARREGLVDLCCSGVGAAAFVGFLLMLALR